MTFAFYLDLYRYMIRYMINIIKVNGFQWPSVDDRNRFVLEPLENGDDRGDYINASYISVSLKLASPIAGKWQWISIYCIVNSFLYISHCSLLGTPKWKSLHSHVRYVVKCSSVYFFTIFIAVIALLTICPYTRDC